MDYRLLEGQQYFDLRAASKFSGAPVRRLRELKRKGLLQFLTLGPDGRKAYIRRAQLESIFQPQTLN